MKELKNKKRTRQQKLLNQKPVLKGGFLWLGVIFLVVCYQLIYSSRLLPILNLISTGMSDGETTAKNAYQSSATTTTTTTKNVKPQCGMKIPNDVTVGYVCQCISTLTDGTPIVNSIWNSDFIGKYLRQAARASLFNCWNWENAIEDVNKTEDKFSKTTDRMIHVLNSYVLKRSIKTSAHPFVMERVVEVVLRRLVDPINNPPLKIAVFGGSVTGGFNSMMNTMGLRENAITSYPGCAWSPKLELLLNQILVGLTSLLSTQEVPLDKVVVVTNYAVSGTDSNGGATMLEYNLFNADMAQYDIFIAAFGANDIQAPDGFVRDRMFEYMQRFMRLAKAQRPCSDLPLVIQLDDIMGDSMDGFMVRQGLRYSQEMIETNNWAGFMSVSYADAVRDIVYGDPTDNIVYDYGNLHPGFNFHTGVAWILTYNLLEGMVGACNAASLPEHDNTREPRGGFPPPLLRDNLLPAEAKVLWKKKSKEQSQLCAKNKTANVQSCVYNWIAAYLSASTAAAVKAVITKVATNIDGWEAIGFPIKKPRRTWIATGGLNSTFTIQLDDLKAPINRMLILYVKSYGTQWKSSKLQVTVEGRKKAILTNDDSDQSTSSSSSSWEKLHEFILSGEHNITTSINYSQRTDLGDFWQEPQNSSVRVTYTLVGGTTFQINGLALCYSEQPFDAVE